MFDYIDFYSQCIFTKDTKNPFIFVQIDNLNPSFHLSLNPKEKVKHLQTDLTLHVKLSN